MNDGFTLINIESITGTPAEHECENGMVDHLPRIAWKFEKSNPINPKETWRDGKYHRDELTLTLTGSFTQYQALIDFISASDPVDQETGLGLYLWFTDKNDTVHGYPVSEIAELGEIPHDARLFNSVYEIKLISIYDNNPHLPAFLNYGSGNYGDENFGY